MEATIISVGLPTIASKLKADLPKSIIVYSYDLSSSTQLNGKYLDQRDQCYHFDEKAQAFPEDWQF